MHWSRPQPDWEDRQQCFTVGQLSPTPVQSHVRLCKDLPFEIPWQLMAITTCLLFSQIYFLKRRKKKKRKKKPQLLFHPETHTHRENNILIFLYSVFVSLSQALCVGVMWFKKIRWNVGGTENAVDIIHLFVPSYTCDQAVILCSSLGTYGLLESSFCKRARTCII